MGLREYARHKGCRLWAVQKAIKAGRIAVDAAGKIDSEAADQAWAANTDQAKQRKEAPVAPPPELPLLTGEIQQAPPMKGLEWPEWPGWTPPTPENLPPAGVENSKVVNGDSFMAAKTRLAWMEVAAREAELAAARGETVGAEAARKVFRDIGRIYARARAAAASEITPQLVGLVDPNEIERRVLRGLVAIDERIANEIAAQFTDLVGGHVERSGTVS